MLEPIEGLPGDVWGLSAVGEVSRKDYEQWVVPYLESARKDGRRIRLLYQLGPRFERFTPGGVWEDTRVGLRYLPLFERCAVVTDVEWIASATQMFAPLAPCPVRVYGNGAFDEAVGWLAAPTASALSYSILPARRVLFIELQSELHAEDFDALSKAVDTWSESTQSSLHGIVVHARERPHWDSLGALFRHARFVRNHQKKVSRVAIAADGKLTAIVPPVLDLLVHPDVRSFPFDEVDRAIEWASGQPGVAHPLQASL